ncbi:hypothetical protein D3C77_443750 [compost metagenome]
MLPEIDAIVQAHQRAGVTAVARGRQIQLGAFAIHVLGVVQAVVVCVIVTGWKQRSEAQLFGQRRLGIAADTQQRLEVRPAAVAQVQRCTDGFAQDLGDQGTCSVSSAGQHLGLQRDAGHTAHQCGVTFQGLARKRALGLEPGRKRVQIG